MIININILNISLLLNIILILLLIYLLYNKYILNNKIKKLYKIIEQMNSSLTYKFESDTEYLLYLLAYKCMTYFKINLEPKLNYNDIKIINGNELDKAVEDITISVWKIMSDNYKNVLLKYFNKSGLMEYISERVMTKMTEITTKYNSSKVNNASRLLNVIHSDEQKQQNKKLNKNSYIQKKDIDNDETT